MQIICAINDTKYIEQHKTINNSIENLNTIDTYINKYTIISFMYGNLKMMTIGNNIGRNEIDTDMENVLVNRVNDTDLYNLHLIRNKLRIKDVKSKSYEQYKFYKCRRIKEDFLSYFNENEIFDEEEKINIIKLRIDNLKKKLAKKIELFKLVNKNFLEYNNQFYKKKKRISDTMDKIESLHRSIDRELRQINFTKDIDVVVEKHFDQLINIFQTNFNFLNRNFTKNKKQELNKKYARITALLKEYGEINVILKKHQMNDMIDERDTESLKSFITHETSLYLNYNNDIIKQAIQRRDYCVKAISQSNDKLLYMYKKEVQKESSAYEKL